jgi:formamidopyrimidine-DNA glycosylase
MIEIPEAATLAVELGKTLAGKTLVSAEANSSPHKFAWYSGDPTTYAKRLTGLTVKGAQAHAAFVELELGKLSLVFAEGVNLRYLEASQPAPAKHQLFVKFEDGSALAASVQMYGGLWLFEGGKTDNEYYLGALKKPNPLDAGFTWEHFQSLAEGVAPTCSVKAFLATEQRVPGLGNGVLQDILLEALLHPKRKLNSLSAPEFKKLYTSTVKVLEKMAKAGGRDTEKDLFGKSGRYLTLAGLYKEKKTCPKCGQAIVKEAYMGGSVYFCPRCQPL